MTRMKRHLKKIPPNILIIAAVLILLIGGFFIFKNISRNNGPETGPYDSFAQCIKDSGAQFYGAYWCPACNAEKDRFGKSARLLPFIECSTPPNDRNQNALCKNEGIQAYPTWRFADGSQEAENMTFEKLSEKTGCSAPKQNP